MWQSSNIWNDSSELKLQHEDIKNRLNSGHICYHPVQKILPSRILSKDLNIKVQKILILPVVLYGREIWSLTLRKEHSLRVREAGENCVMISFITSSNVIRLIKSRRMRWAEHAACMGKMRNAYRILVAKL
jgi:hypothetical protein